MASSKEYGMMGSSIDNEAMYGFLIYIAQLGENSDSLNILLAALYPDAYNLFFAANIFSGEVLDLVSGWIFCLLLLSEQLENVFWGLPTFYDDGDGSGNGTTNTFFNHLTFDSLNQCI